MRLRAAFLGVYHMTPKLEIEAIAKVQTRPNGIALSPDGGILYVANSGEKNIRAYEVDKKGHASNERIVGTGLEGADGMKVDVKGNL
ncbi:MAG: SMP-30/gluconolactonase/LRE family protein [Bryobacterales bacterium]|nr:SMP-30/gluconolactonase/LRE family protein [Bryobacterales bacterium]